MGKEFEITSKELLKDNFKHIADNFEFDEYISFKDEISLIALAFRDITQLEDGGAYFLNIPTFQVNAFSWTLDNKTNFFDLVEISEDTQIQDIYDHFRYAENDERLPKMKGYQEAIDKAIDTAEMYCNGLNIGRLFDIEAYATELPIEYQQNIAELKETATEINVMTDEIKNIMGEDTEEDTGE